MKRKLVPRSLWKRTYVPGIFWQGVGNNYSYNTVTNGPHNCMLGGGNEDWPWGLGNMEVGSGSQCVFQGNTLDTCAYECGDCGAFYTCGQGGSAWVNRGNVVRNATFRNIGVCFLTYQHYKTAQPSWIRSDTCRFLVNGQGLVQSI